MNITAKGGKKQKRSLPMQSMGLAHRCSRGTIARQQALSLENHSQKWCPSTPSVGMLLYPASRWFEGSLTFKMVSLINGGLEVQWERSDASLANPSLIFPALFGVWCKKANGSCQGHQEHICPLKNCGCFRTDEQAQLWTLCDTGEEISLDLNLCPGTTHLPVILC